MHVITFDDKYLYGGSAMGLLMARELWSNKSFKSIIQYILFWVFIQLNDDKIYTRIDVGYELFIHSRLSQPCIV